MSAGHTVYKVTFYSVILLFVVIIDWTVTPLNESPLCVVDNKKGWISIHRYPAFVNPDSHTIGFSSFLS